MTSILHRRPSIALMVALVLWTPSLLAFAHGALDLVPAATRFLIAFGVAWVGVTILGMIVAGYGQQEGSTGPQRRRNDAAAEPPPAEEMDTEAA